MRNVAMSVEKDILTVKIDLSKSLGDSKSGKTVLVATTGGNQLIEGHPGLKIGVNCYKAKPEK